MFTVLGFFWMAWVGIGIAVGDERLTQTSVICMSFWHAAAMIAERLPAKQKEGDQ